VDEILAAASHLFGELGVGGTTMSRIAKEVGLRQSSLYYYFSRKEEILAALVARANVLSLELIQRIVADGGAPAVQLYRFVRGDVVALCALPFDINEIHRVAARDPDGFATYWDERSAMERHISRIIRKGISDGVFRDVHVRRAALTVLSNDEGVQNWYRVGKPGPTGRIADEVADQSVGGLLADSTALPEVRAQALAAEA
jgi:AcrR family transcriptional regulator